MKFSIYIDYASLFISTKKAYKIKDKNKLELQIYKIIMSVEKYLYEYFEGRDFEILEKKAFILPDKVFGMPEYTLGKKGIQFIRVNDELKKSQYKKKLNLSRADDSALVSSASKDILEKKLSGIVVISNDYDFKTLAQMTINHGLYFCGAVNEGKGVSINKDFKNQCDIYLRIREILENSTDGYEDLNDFDEVNAVTGKRIEIYRNKQLILSYPLESNKAITIGRRSTRRKILPNIDLTSFDKEKIISREHGIIDFNGNDIMYTVHDNCSRGTWYNLKAKSKGTRFLLSPNIPMILGDSKGFVLIYRNM